MFKITPASPFQNVASEEDRHLVKKISDDDKDLFSKNKKKQDVEILKNQLEQKLKKIITSKVVLNLLSETGENNDQLKEHLLKIAHLAASSYLKKELLNVAKSILSVSANEIVDLDEDETIFAKLLAKYVLKLSNSKQSNKTAPLNLKKPNPNEDKNAGFLVHYCKDILNAKPNLEKKQIKLKRITPEELEKIHLK